MLARIMQATAPNPSTQCCCAWCLQGDSCQFLLSPELWSWPPMLRVPYLQWSSSRSNVSPPPGRPWSCMAEGSSCWQHKLHNLRGTSRGFGQKQGPKEIYSLPLPPFELTIQLASQDSRLDRRTLSLRRVLPVFDGIPPLVFRNVPKQVFQGRLRSRESQSLCLDSEHFWQVECLCIFSVFYCIFSQMTYRQKNQVNYQQA